ncbi:hypothetical protein Glove_122g137 [Diversispora epigaea]|uniref:Uncharacterized protein n=1 Tax=Diversispora epigaea TaxID=1348612 RepID=A0A397IZ50_9GLOM|nr:hypothetical protein Glove_122g137 [Diversispora epigaea]
MPRTYRFIRAITHNNSIIGVIIFLQEKIKDINRRLIGSNFTALEIEVSSLREQLQTLQDRYQLLTDNNRAIWSSNYQLSRYNEELVSECSRLRRNLVRRWSQYLRGSSRNFLHQFQLYEYEISHLRSSIALFNYQFDYYNVPYPDLPLSPRWISTCSSAYHPPMWIENLTWDTTHPLNLMSNPSIFTLPSPSYEIINNEDNNN